MVEAERGVLEPEHADKVGGQPLRPVPRTAEDCHSRNQSYINTAPTPHLYPHHILYALPFVTAASKK